MFQQNNKIYLPSSDKLFRNTKSYNVWAGAGDQEMIVENVKERNLE